VYAAHTPKLITCKFLNLTNSFKILGAESILTRVQEISLNYHIRQDKRLWITVDGLWFTFYGVWFMVYGLCFMVYGLWFVVYGLWFMVYGLWFMVYGSWFIVYGL
jgi:hypothetical protein